MTAVATGTGVAVLKPSMQDVPDAAGANTMIVAHCAGAGMMPAVHGRGLIQEGTAGAKMTTGKAGTEGTEDIGVRARERAALTREVIRGEAESVARARGSSQNSVQDGSRAGSKAAC